MKRSVLAFVLLIAPLSAISAQQPETQPRARSKYREECALTSKEFVGKLPSTFTTVWCADDKRADFGPMGSDVIHAMVVAAFFDKRMDRRVSAMNLLEKYECESATECRDFHYLLDWGIKSGHPARYSRDLAKRAEALRTKLIPATEGN